MVGELFRCSLERMVKRKGARQEVLLETHTRSKIQILNLTWVSLKMKEYWDLGFNMTSIFYLFYFFFFYSQKQAVVLLEIQNFLFFHNFHMPKFNCFFPSAEKVILIRRQITQIGCIQFAHSNMQMNTLLIFLPKY